MSLNKLTAFDRGQPVNMLLSANKLQLNDQTTYPLYSTLQVGADRIIYGTSGSSSTQNLYDSINTQTLNLTTAGTFQPLLRQINGFRGTNEFKPSSLRNGDRISFKCAGIYTTTTSPSPSISGQGADFKIIFSLGDESIVYNNAFSVITDNKGMVFSQAQANTRRMFEIDIDFYCKTANGAANNNFTIITKCKTSSFFGTNQGSGSQSIPYELSSYQQDDITISFSNATVLRFEPQMCSSVSSSSNPDFVVFVEKSTIRQHSGSGL
jgi:hypothetical protein